MTFRTLAAALVLSAAAGCADGSAPVESLETPATEVAPSEVAPSAAYESIVVGMNSLDVVTAETTESVARGSTRDEAVAALAPYLGAPTSESMNEECPLGPALTAKWADGVSLLFEAVDGASTLTGWQVSGADGRLRGPSGVALGMSRDALLAQPDARLGDDGMLDNEFFVGAQDGVGGFLSGPDADARVTELFVGTTCIAR